MTTSAKQSASAKRYADWTATRAEHGMTFGEWLKSPPLDESDDCESCLGTGIGNPHSGSSCWVCRGGGTRHTTRSEYQ